MTRHRSTVPFHLTPTCLARAQRDGTPVGVRIRLGAGEREGGEGADVGEGEIEKEGRSIDGEVGRMHGHGHGDGEKATLNENDRNGARFLQGRVAKVRYGALAAI